MQAGGNPLDAATLRRLAEAVMGSTPQPGVQSVDLAQNLLQDNPSADALMHQLAQMQVQNQQVNYQQQVGPLSPRLLWAKYQLPMLQLASVKYVYIDTESRLHMSLLNGQQVNC